MFVCICMCIYSRQIKTNKFICICISMCMYMSVYVVHINIHNCTFFPSRDDKVFVECDLKAQKYLELIP